MDLGRIPALKHDHRSFKGRKTVVNRRDCCRIDAIV